MGSSAPSRHSLPVLVTDTPNTLIPDPKSRLGDVVETAECLQPLKTPFSPLEKRTRPEHDNRGIQRRKRRKVLPLTPPGSSILPDGTLSPQSQRSDGGAPPFIVKALDEIRTIVSSVFAEYSTHDENIKDSNDDYHVHLRPMRGTRRVGEGDAAKRPRWTRGDGDLLRQLKTSNLIQSDIIIAGRLGRTVSGINQRWSKISASK